MAQTFLEKKTVTMTLNKGHKVSHTQNPSRGQKQVKGTRQGQLLIGAGQNSAVMHGYAMKTLDQ